MATPMITPPPVAATASLYGLPNEILLNITGHLEPEELLDLRFVCRRFGKHFYPTMPTEWIIVADSPRQLRKLIEMTEPGQAGCLLDKLTLVETLPVYLSCEQYVEAGNLDWTDWTPKGPSEPPEESSSEYEPSECSSEEYDEDEGMVEDWEAEDDVGSEEENDGDLDLGELTAKYAAVLKTSDDPTVDWETLWPPYYVPPYYDAVNLNSNHVLPDDIEPTDWLYPLGSWDNEEKTLTKLLARAFKNLKHNTEECHLLELDLKAASLKSGVTGRDIDCKAPSTMMGELFHRVAVALHMSKLAITKLTIGHGKAVLDTGRLENILDDNSGWYATKLELRHSLYDLKKLSIKFAYVSEDIGVACGHCSKKHKEDGESLVRLLGCTPYLRALHLNGYQAWNTSWRVLEQSINAGKLYHDNMKSITLEGFGVEDDEVRYFLSKFKYLQSLTLKGLYLTPEEYERVFEIIEKEMPELSHLHLNNLYEVDSEPGRKEDANRVPRSDPRLVYFEGDGPSRFPPNHGPNFITRTGAEARTAVKKKAKIPGQGESSDSSAYLEWERRWKDNYGGFPGSS